MLSELSRDEQEVGMERFSFGDDVASCRGGIYLIA